MSVLKRIFRWYYEDRQCGAKPDPDGMGFWRDKIMEEVRKLGASDIDIDEVMEPVGLYAAEAEQAGFIAGFRMAWELLEDMQK